MTDRFLPVCGRALFDVLEDHASDHPLAYHHNLEPLLAVVGDQLCSAFTKQTCQAL